MYLPDKMKNVKKDFYKKHENLLKKLVSSLIGNHYLFGKCKQTMTNGKNNEYILNH